MIVKTKCVFLKQGIQGETLRLYGFETSNSGESYWRYVIPTDPFEGIVVWYADTRRFVYKYPKMTSAKRVIPYIQDVYDDNLAEVRPYYEWVAIIGRWQNYSDEKQERILKKLDKLNGDEQ